MSWWRRLLPYGYSERWPLAGIILLMVITALLEAFKPWPLKLIVDNVIPGKPLPSAVEWVAALSPTASAGALLAMLAGATILIAVVLQASKLIQSSLQAGAGARMSYALGAELFEHIQRLSLSFHAKNHAGDLLRRVTIDSGCVRDLVLWVGLLGATSLVTLVFMFYIMWRLDPLLAVLALMAAPPLAILTRHFSKPLSNRQYEQEQLMGETMALAEQTLTALPVVQSFVRHRFEDARFRKLSRRTVEAYLRVTSSGLRFKIATGLVTAAAMAAIMALGGLHVLRGDFTVGSLLVFLSYVASLYAPMETIAYLASGVAQASARARCVYQVLDNTDRRVDSADARPLPPARKGISGHIRVQQVSFSYGAGPTVLREVTLEARPGETIAIVGATGAGKSTLVSLLPRFYDPTSGFVTFDGIDLRKICLESLRSNIALVTQDSYLLPVTIADNIAYGRPGANRTEIIAAATAAQAAEFVERLPNGYDTVVGERGATLSGGERQRISIARAILKDAPVLILDEPSAALDARTESALVDGFAQLLAGRTTLVIAHRLSTIQRADRIVVMESGRIVETGTHAQLAVAAGPYQRLNQTQLALR